MSVAMGLTGSFAAFRVRVDCSANAVPSMAARF
jgi:hypothetical protein